LAILWQKSIGAKAARNILMKLTAGANHRFAEQSVLESFSSKTSLSQFGNINS